MTPRIRPDLKATPAEEQGVKYFDVADPRSGSRMRLYDFEWLIAEQMNGARRFDEVADYARDRLGIQPSPKDLESYADKLAELGFFEEGIGARPAAQEPEAAPSAPKRTSDAEPAAAPTAPRDLGTAKTMMAVAAPTPARDQPPHAEPPKPEPVPAPAVAPITTVEKKPSSASQSAAMAAAASSTGKVTAVGDQTTTPAKSGSGSLLLVIFVLLAVGGVVAYMKFGRPQTAQVTVILASPREVVRLYDGLGPVKKTDAQLLSFGEAGKLSDVVAKGTETKPGMPLATLESYAQIEKQLADVKDRLKYYEAKLEASKAKNDEARVKTDETKVQEKKKLMGELEVRAAKVRLLAPGTGTVSEVLVAAGGEVKAGAPVVKLGGKQMSAEFKADGPKPGAAVQVQSASGGATLNGKVIAAANGTVTVELPEEAPFKSGDPLRLVKNREANVIPVPLIAVTQRDGADVVFVLADGEAHSRKITVVDKTATEALISSGLAAGDSVITSNAADLQEGQKASSQ